MRFGAMGRQLRGRRRLRCRRLRLRRRLGPSDRHRHARAHQAVVRASFCCTFLPVQLVWVFSRRPVRALTPLVRRWYLVPAGESAAPSPSPAPAPSSSSAAPAPAPTAESTQSSSSSSSSDGAYQFNEAQGQVKAAVAPTSSESTSAASSSSSDSKQATWNPAGFWESSSSTISLSGIDTSNVNSQDRTTWICRHPGWWLAK